MGDARHKKSPPTGPKERVDDDLRDAVRKLMLSNRLYNEANKLEPGDREYRIADHADLANAALGGDKTMLSKIIGPAKPGTKIKLVRESRYIAAIRKAMGIAPPELATITVPAARAETLRKLATLPQDLFEIFEARVNDVPD